MLTRFQPVLGEAGRLSGAFGEFGAKEAKSDVSEFNVERSWPGNSAGRRAHARAHKRKQLAEMAPDRVVSECGLDE